MADTATLHKKAFVDGEELQQIEIYSSATGSVVVNRQPIWTIRLHKNVYDALTAGQKTAITAPTLAQIRDAVYGTSEI